MSRPTRPALPATGPDEGSANVLRWERRWRRGLIEQARQLALGLGLGNPNLVTPYATGIVMSPGEDVCAETWARCNLDQLRFDQVASNWPASCWAITSARLIGRLGSGRLAGWRWESLTAYQVDIRREQVELHMTDGRVVFHGPGAVVVGVAAVWRVHGFVGLLEHPGLAPLRAGDKR